MIVRSLHVGTPVMMKLNLEGDRQADTVHHGGPDKAACLYPHEHYAYWEAELGWKLPVAAFGENMTVAGLTEETVCIGDTYQIGEATVQVSQPRVPCYKLAARLGVPDMVKRASGAGYTGYDVFRNRHDLEGARRLLEAEGLAEVWRKLMHRILGEG